MTIADAKKLTVLPTIWIHTGAGPQMGFGHLNRCMILAGELENSARALFILRVEDQWSGDILKARGLTIRTLIFPIPGAIHLLVRSCY